MASVIRSCHSFGPNHLGPWFACHASLCPAQNRQLGILYIESTVNTAEIALFLYPAGDHVIQKLEMLHWVYMLMESM